MSATAMDIAILGMGRMGRSVALRLLDSGHDVAVWNRSPGKADDVVAAGAKESDSVRDAVDGRDVVLVSLATDDAVREVVLGDDGLKTHVGQAVYAEMSTISPALSEELAEQIDRYVAMPIVGSPDAVRGGKATYLLGGAPTVIDELDPLLDGLAANRHQYDEPRLANVAKLTGNALLLTTIVGLAESIAVGRAGGLSDDQLNELLSTSPIIGDGAKNRLPALINGEGPVWWTVALGRKDAGLALDLVSSDAPGLPALSAAHQRYDEAASHDLADEDIATVTRLYIPTT